MYFNVVSIVLISAAVAMETVTMEVTQPSTAGPVCPGQEVTLTCTVTQTGNTENIILIWTVHINHYNLIANIHYHSDSLHIYSGPYSIYYGGFITKAKLVNTTNSITILSNMTIKTAAFVNNDNRIYCRSPPHDTSQTETIVVEGT